MRSRELTTNSNRENSQTLRVHAWTAMGTLCNAHVYPSPEACADTVLAAIVGEVARLESRYSRYRGDSVVAKINCAAAEGGRVEVDEETAGLLDYAWACYQSSGGLFDISSGVLRRVWDFRSGVLPSRADVEAILPRVGLERVKWTRPVLCFKHAGMELDLGGIVKEYAADRCVLIARGLGIRHGLIDLGEDMAVIGKHPDGEPWEVGIQMPGRQGAMAMVRLSRGAVASSGNYERCIIANGKRYGHILDPRTGWPVHGLAAVSVLGDQCIIAGSISTIAILKGESGAAWLRSLSIDHCWMDERQRTGATAAFSVVANGASSTAA